MLSHAKNQSPMSNVPVFDIGENTGEIVYACVDIIIYMSIQVI